jgi:hypothetical protein
MIRIGIKIFFLSLFLYSCANNHVMHDNRHSSDTISGYYDADTCFGYTVGELRMNGYVLEGLGERSKTSNKYLQNKLDSICRKKGHIPDGNMIGETCMYCPNDTIRNDSETVVVIPGCNDIEYDCARCGRHIIFPEKDVRKIIWRSKPIINKTHSIKQKK